MAKIINLFSFFLTMITFASITSQYERSNNYLNWLLMYNAYCQNMSEELLLVSRCSEEYGKVYLFSDKRLTLAESQKHCKHHFSMPSASDLVVFGSCDEYKYVQDLLLDIANSRRDLWDQDNGSKTLETWTKSDRIPMGSRPLERGRVYKRSPDEDTDEDYVEDETDVTTCSTNNTFMEGSLWNSSEEYSHRNLTTSFRPWTDGDQTETRYPICQLKFDRIFWNAGKFNLTPDDQTQITTVATIIGTLPTAEEELNMTTEISNTDVVTETVKPVTEPSTVRIQLITTPAAPTDPVTTEPVTASTVTQASAVVMLSSRPTGTPKQSTPGEAIKTPSVVFPADAATDGLVITPAPNVSRVEHSVFYEEANSVIRHLKERLKSDSEDHHGGGGGSGAGGLGLPVLKLDLMHEANQVASNLVSHCKKGGNPDPQDVQEFIYCMKNLHELVTDVLTPSMDHNNKDPANLAARSKVIQQAMNFSSLAVDGFSTLLNKPDPWILLDHTNRSQSAIAMMNQVHELSFTLGCMLSSDHHEIRQDNIVLEIFGIDSGVIQSNFSFPRTEGNPIISKQSRVRFTSEVAVRKNSCGRHVASGIIYHNLAAHMMPGEEDVFMNSQLVSFSLSNSTESIDLEQGSKVEIIFIHLKPLMFGDVSNCVFWDMKQHNWSGHRCDKVPSLSSRNQTVCQCDHLTNFAVLMDISNREDNDEVKNLLTIVCSSASVLCLTLTIGCILFVKSLRNRRSVITANLSTCLLATNLLVVFGFDQTTDLLICRIVSGLTLYSLLSAFMWMLMEGYLLYQMIILVFRSVGHLNTTTLYLLGYIPPAIILMIFVTVTGSEGLFDPEYSYFCWISNSNRSSYIWSFAGPALAIVLINAVILTRSFVAALASQNSKKASPSAPPPPNTSASTGNNNSNNGSAGMKNRIENIKRWLTGWSSLMILVGLTWITGILYIHEAASWFSYLFICLNGLQGVWIFVFEILLNSKTRTSLIQVMRRKIPNASKYLPSLSKTSSNNLSNTSKTKSTNTCPSPMGSQSNLSRNIAMETCCSQNFCDHVVTEPDGKDYTPHHLFHHHHAVPRLVMHEKFSTFSERL